MNDSVRSLPDRLVAAGEPPGGHRPSRRLLGHLPQPIAGTRTHSTEGLQQSCQCRLGVDARLVEPKLGGRSNALQFPEAGQLPLVGSRCSRAPATGHAGFSA